MAGSEQESTSGSDTSTHTDVAGLGYEEARDELAAIVAQLEGGQATLEDSMRLWERGEALAVHCQTWLDGAQERLDARAGSGEDD